MPEPIEQLETGYLAFLAHPGWNELNELKRVMDVYQVKWFGDDEVVRTERYGRINNLPLTDINKFGAPQPAYIARIHDQKAEDALKVTYQNAQLLHDGKAQSAICQFCCDDQGNTDGSDFFYSVSELEAHLLTQHHEPAWVIGQEPNGEHIETEVCQVCGLTYCHRVYQGSPHVCQGDT